MHKDVTKVVVEINLQLIKGVDTHEQFTSVWIILLTSDYTNVVMARVGRNKVCGYGPCANTWYALMFGEMLEKEVIVFRSRISS